MHKSALNQLGGTRRAFHPMSLQMALNVVSPTEAIGPSQPIGNLRLASAERDPFADLTASASGALSEYGAHVRL